MLKKVFILLFLGLIVASLAACYQPSAPTAEFVDYKLASITPEGLEFNFFFNASNPNPLSLDITKYIYKIYIEDQELIAETRAGFTIPANGKQLIKIPVMLSYDKIFGGTEAIIQRLVSGNDKVNYRIEGSISSSLMSVIFTTPFKSEGQITLPKEITIKNTR